MFRTYSPTSRSPARSAAPPASVEVSTARIRITRPVYIFHFRVDKARTPRQHGRKFEGLRARDEKVAGGSGAGAGVLFVGGRGAGRARGPGEGRQLRGPGLPRIRAVFLDREGSRLGRLNLTFAKSAPFRVIKEGSRLLVRVDTPPPPGGPVLAAPGLAAARPAPAEPPARRTPPPLTAPPPPPRRPPPPPPRPSP